MEELLGELDNGIDHQEKLAKVTLYVEHNMQYYHYYVVLESVQGNTVVTEQHQDGSVSFDENPADVSDRNSLAKVMYAADCSARELSIMDIKAVADMHVSNCGASDANRNEYAKSMYNRAGGDELTCGSMQQTPAQERWQQWSTEDWKARMKKMANQ